MATPEKLGIQDLVVGGRYLHLNGLFIRQIDGIEGDVVITTINTGMVGAAGGCF